MSNARSRQLAYFKDNIQTQDDHDDFDASQYYYNRDDQMTPTTGSSPGVLLGGATNATHSEPGSASALYRSGQPHFNSPVHGMNGAPYNNTPSGIGNLQQQVAPLTSSFATNHPSRSLPVPQMGHSSSTPYAPSSDLLAMLSKGVPINSATEVSGVESRYADDTTVNSSRIGLVGAAAPSHGRGGPFKMSDFPALDGRASTIAINGTARDAQLSVDSTANFPGMLRGDSIVREEPLHQSGGALLSEQIKKDDATARQITSQSGSFAMQSEDFPALPGSQPHHQAALFSEADAIDAVPETLEVSTTATFRCGNVIGIQFPAMGHSEIPPKHLMPLHATSENDSNLFKLTDGCDPDLGANASLNPAVELRHFANQGTKFQAHSCLAESAKANMEIKLAHNTYGPESNAAIDHSLSSSTDSRMLTSSSGTTNQITSKASMLPESNEIENQTKYGLLGLLDVIRMTNADLNTLALGSDLTTLGLNLNSSECLYSTFASPWAEAPTTREPQFSLPMCYYMQPPPLKTSHLSKFQLETLFYIFYAMPRDVLQAYSAQEL
jgi:hypothetical protein